MSIWQDHGQDATEARIGFSRVLLDIPVGKPLAGYSVGGSGFGAWTRTPLYARAMYLEGSNGERVAVVVLDLMSASRYVHDKAAALTRARFGLGRNRLVVCGTHTHTAPGGFYGNSLYDTLASHDLLHGFDRAFADLVVARTVDAVAEAIAHAQPGTVRVDVERAWGVSRNRSIKAFSHNEDHLLWNNLPGMPGEGAPPGLDVEQMRVDPRVVVLSAYDARGHRAGVFATFACHNTALGPHARAGKPFYDPDWTGAAARIAERSAAGAPFVLVALSGAGDQSPMAARNGQSAGPREQGEERAEWVGAQVAAAILRANQKGAAGSRPPVGRVAHKDWWTNAGGPDPNWATIDGARLAPWSFGAPTLGGAEDGRSMFAGVAPEGKTSDDFPPSDLQHPKAPALGFLQRFVATAGPLRPSPVHALHVVRVNDHAFATVPGEPTAWVAHEIAAALLETVDVGRAFTASVIGYTNDYVGYFTTRAEFRAQHYEGSSTLFGRESAEHLTAHLRRLATEEAQEAEEALPPYDDARPEAAAVPPPMAHVEDGRVVAVWSFPRDAAPDHFPVRVFEAIDGADAALDDARVRAEPRDFWVGATPISAWVVAATIEGPARGRRFVVVAAGEELTATHPEPEPPAPDAALERGAAREASVASPRRFHAVFGTWNSFGVPQLENILMQGSSLPARFRSTTLLDAIDSPDVLCAQELIGAEARALFDGLGSYPFRMRKGGVFAEDHGLGVGSRLKVEASRDMHFRTKAVGNDRFIAKGAMHVRVRLTRGPLLDIVTTHLQAGGAADRVAVRAAQLEELAAFVRDVSDPTRPLLVCGDLNVNSAAARAEYEMLLARMTGLGLRDLDPQGRLLTSDPVQNAMLRQVEPGAARERLDYLFWRAPADGFELRVESVRLFLASPLADLRDSWKSLTGLEPDAFASDHFGLQVDVTYTPTLG